MDRILSENEAVWCNLATLLNDPGKIFTAQVLPVLRKHGRAPKRKFDLVMDREIDSIRAGNPTSFVRALVEHKLKLPGSGGWEYCSVDRDGVRITLKVLKERQRAMDLVTADPPPIDGGLHGDADQHPQSPPSHHPGYKFINERQPSMVEFESENEAEDENDYIAEQFRVIPDPARHEYDSVVEQLQKESRIERSLGKRELQERFELIPAPQRDNSMYSSVLLGAMGAGLKQWDGIVKRLRTFAEIAAVADEPLQSSANDLQTLANSLLVDITLMKDDFTIEDTFYCHQSAIESKRHILLQVDAKTSQYSLWPRRESRSYEPPSAMKVGMPVSPKSAAKSTFHSERSMQQYELVGAPWPENVALIEGDQYVADANTNRTIKCYVTSCVIGKIRRWSVSKYGDKVPGAQRPLELWGGKSENLPQTNGNGAVEEAESSSSMEVADGMVEARTLRSYYDDLPSALSDRHALSVMEFNAAESACKEESTSRKLRAHFRAQTGLKDTVALIQQLEKSLSNSLKYEMVTVGPTNAGKSTSLSGVVQDKIDRTIMDSHFAVWKPTLKKPAEVSFSAISGESGNKLSADVSEQLAKAAEDAYKEVVVRATKAKGFEEYFNVNSCTILGAQGGGATTSIACQVVWGEKPGLQIKFKPKEEVVETLTIGRDAAARRRVMNVEVESDEARQDLENLMDNAMYILGKLDLRVGKSVAKVRAAVDGTDLGVNEDASDDDCQESFDSDELFDLASDYEFPESIRQQVWSLLGSTIGVEVRARSQEDLVREVVRLLVAFSAPTKCPWVLFGVVETVTVFLPSRELIDTVNNQRTIVRDLPGMESGDPRRRKVFMSGLHTALQSPNAVVMHVVKNEAITGLFFRVMTEAGLYTRLISSPESVKVIVTLPSDNYTLGVDGLKELKQTRLKEYRDWIKKLLRSQNLSRVEMEKVVSRAMSRICFAVIQTHP